LDTVGEWAKKGRTQQHNVETGEVTDFGRRKGGIDRFLNGGRAEQI